MVLTSIYMGVSVYCPECTVCLCFCVISNQSTSTKPHYVPDLSKLDNLLHKTHTKVLLVLRYPGSTLSKSSVGVDVRGKGGKLKKGVRQYRKGFNKIGDLGIPMLLSNPYQNLLCYEITSLRSYHDSVMVETCMPIYEIIFIFLSRCIIYFVCLY